MSRRDGSVCLPRGFLKFVSQPRVWGRPVPGKCQCSRFGRGLRNRHCTQVPEAMLKERVGTPRAIFAHPLPPGTPVCPLMPVPPASLICLLVCKVRAWTRYSPWPSGPESPKPVCCRSAGHLPCLRGARCCARAPQGTAQGCWSRFLRDTPEPGTPWLESKASPVCWFAAAG